MIGAGNLDPDFAEHEGRCDVGRAHTGGERAKGTVGAGVRIAADDQLARCDQTFFGKHDVLDAAAPDVEEVLDLLLDGEIFHELGELGRLRVLGRYEVVFDQRDLAGVEDARRAFHAAHHADGDGGGELVGQNEVGLRVNDLARFDAFESGVPRENLFGKCHAHDKPIIARSNAWDPLRCMHDRTFGFATRALHAGTPPDPATGSRAVPIYQTAAFVFGSTEQAAELFALRSYGHIYSRISNPTVAAFEERMASLEGGLGAVAFSSGLAAQLCTVLSLAQAGDHVVCTQNVYGGTVTQLSVTIKRMGIETTFVPVDDFAAMRDGDPARKRGCSSPRRSATRRASSPISRALAEVAHDAGVPLVVDNTFATPYLCRPIERGADIVVHSATKFINGHGTAIGGVLVESGTFPWGSGRFPLLSEPSPGYQQKVFTETFGEYAFLMRARAEVLRDVGATMSPMDAWLVLLGLETLPLRMDAARRAIPRRSSRSCKERAEVAWVREPQMGSIFTFGLTRRPRSRPAFHRRARAVEPPGQRRRRQEPGDPSRHQPRTRSSPTTSCARRASSPSRCASPSVWKTSTILSGISITRLRAAVRA